MKFDELLNGEKYPKDMCMSARMVLEDTSKSRGISYEEGMKIIEELKPELIRECERVMNEESVVSKLL